MVGIDAWTWLLSMGHRIKVVVGVPKPSDPVLYRVRNWMPICEIAVPHLIELEAHQLHLQLPCINRGEACKFTRDSRKTEESN